MRIFVDELPLKVLSMVLAVTLFVLVRSDKDATSGAYVKVIYTLPEDRVLVSDPVAGGQGRRARAVDASCSTSIARSSPSASTLTQRSRRRRCASTRT